MTDEMTAWLRAQLDDDERDARERRGIFPSAAVDEHANVWLHVTERGTAVVTKYLHATEGYRDVAHLRRWCEPSNGEGWNTERVLREVEAKRLILDKHGIIWRDIGWLERDGNELIESYEELPVCVTCVPKHSHFPTRNDVPVGPCLTVRLLASIFSGRPGYRAEWAL